jgi:hypothetical protein
MAEVDAVDEPILTRKHNPDSVLDYGIDWSEWLDFDDDGTPDDEIASSEWEIPDGFTSVLATNDTTITAFWPVVDDPDTIEEGSYYFRNTITTNSTPVARVETRTIELIVMRR